MTRIVLFLFTCVLCACGNGIPKKIMPPEKMEAVLWDMLLADELAEYSVQKDSTIKTLEKHDELYQQLFQIHKITKEDFKQSLHYYENHPQLLRPIFDSLQKKSEKVIKPAN